MAKYDRISKAGSMLDTPGLSELGCKNDIGKVRTDLLPIKALMGVADVLTYGAGKYKDRNWEKGLNFSRVYGALLRHLFAWWDSEDYDPESGKLHLAHVATNAMFLLHYAQSENYNGFDDRLSSIEEALEMERK